MSKARNAVIFLLICFTLAAAKNDLPEEVKKNLKKAGRNKSELLAVIEHYKDDGEKLQAAYYLIANMDGQCYAPFTLENKKKKTVEFDMLAYPDFNAMTEAFKKCEKENGGLRYSVDKLVSDLKTIKAEFLIENIDYAFLAWKELPWAKGYPFEVFLDHILPYRGSNEPLDNWRKPLYEKYKDIASRMKDPSDLMEAIRIVNDDVRSWFKFDPRFYYHPTDQGYSEMLRTKLGRCEDMTNLTIYALRAIGIAVTSDYTPHWAKTGNNHAWNAIVLHNGEAVPFMGAEANPGEYKLSNDLAKAYRKMFRKVKEAIYFKVKKKKNIPPWLGGRNYTDVTKDYVTVSDIPYSFVGKTPREGFAYICVFNSGEWAVMHWGKIERGNTVFTDMGNNDILYLPAFYIKNKVKPCGEPFILRKNGSMETIITEKEKNVTLRLYSTTKRKLLESTDGIMLSNFAEGEYELFCWSEGEWQSFGKRTAVKDEPLVFEKIPKNGLYWLVDPDGDKEERPFTISPDGEQVFW